MTKKHQREIDVVERLEKENRELKATVRALQRRLKKVDREYKATEEVEKTEEEEKTFIPQAPKCKTCERGYIEEIKIGKGNFWKCTVCPEKGRRT